jgi:cell wall-associated NlpC family hydrolase
MSPRLPTCLSLCFLFWAGALLSVFNTVHAEKPTDTDPLTSLILRNTALPDQQAQTGKASEISPPVTQQTPTVLSKITDKTHEVVLGALQYIGVRYRWGGNTPKTGFDCSGLVRYVFNNLGIALPRRAVEMSRVGRKVSADALQPGDLVFFNTRRSTFSHVGIHIGQGRFIHAPSTGKNVRIDQISNRYWKKRFTGARRLDAFVIQPTLVKQAYHTKRTDQQKNTTTH